MSEQGMQDPKALHILMMVAGEDLASRALCFAAWFRCFQDPVSKAGASGYTTIQERTHGSEHFFLAQSGQELFQASRLQHI